MKTLSDQRSYSFCFFLDDNALLIIAFTDCLVGGAH